LPELLTRLSTPHYEVVESTFPVWSAPHLQEENSGWQAQRWLHSCIRPVGETSVSGLDGNAGTVQH